MVGMGERGRCKTRVCINSWFMALLVRAGRVCGGVCGGSCLLVGFLPGGGGSRRDCSKH